MFVQYSQHQELITNNSSNNNKDDHRSDNQENGRPNGTVLKVIVTNIIYPVTIEVLQQVSFKPCYYGIKYFLNFSIFLENMTIVVTFGILSSYL